MGEVMMMNRRNTWRDIGVFVLIGLLIPRTPFLTKLMLRAFFRAFAASGVPCVIGTLTGLVS